MQDLSKREPCQLLIGGNNLGEHPAEETVESRRPTSAPGRLSCVKDDEFEPDSDVLKELVSTKLAGEGGASPLRGLLLMVDEAQIKAQAAQLHKSQFTRGADQWDIRLDPDYQEFYMQKQREEVGPRH